MSLLACQTTVSYVDLLGWLIASGNLGKLTHVPDTSTAGFLAVNPVQAGGLPFLDFFDLVLLMTATKRAVCPEF